MDEASHSIILQRSMPDPLSLKCEGGGEEGEEGEEEFILNLQTQVLI